MHALLKCDVFMIMNTCLLHNTQNMNLNLWQRSNVWDEKFLWDEKNWPRITFMYKRTYWTHIFNNMAVLILVK